jgi:hypothetical protein
MSSKPKFDPTLPFAEVKPKFDPTAQFDVLDEEPKPSGPPISEIESAIRGGVQGFPFVGSYADEAEGALRSLFSGRKYVDERDAVRGEYKAAEDANPGSYIGGLLTTGVLGDIPKAIPVLGQAYGAVEGGVYGLGASEADLTKGEVGGALQDTGTGAAIGAIAPKVLQYGGKALKKTLEKAGDVAGSIGLKTGRVLTGVPEEKAAYYVKNRDAVNSAKDLEEIKSLVDSGVAKVADDLDTKAGSLKSLKERARELKQTADDAFQVERERLSKARPPEEMAESIQESMESIRGDLAKRSSDAFNILNEQGIVFKRQPLKAAVTRQLNDMKVAGKVPTVGPAASAYKQVESLEKFINSFGKQEEIPAGYVKEIIQNIDQASKAAYDPFNRNDVAANALADVRRSFDKTLKAESPEYAQVMSELAPQAKFYNDLDKIFKDPDKIKSVLRMASNPDSSQGRQAMILLKSMDQRLGTKYSQDINGYLKAQNTLKSVEGLRGVRESLPETADLMAGRKAIEGAETDLTEAKLWAEPFSKLGPANTEGMLKKQMFGRDIEGRKALDELGEREGQDFGKMLQDTATRDTFLKDSTQGSRKTNLGGMVGKGTGLVFGEGVGAAVGATVDKYGGRIYKKALDSTTDIKEKAASFGKKYQHVFDQASGRKGGVAVTHHLLMQTDPEYREKMNADKEK